MSHGAAKPPSLATRALHGAACMNGSRPALGNANLPAGILPGSARKPRAIATTAHPLFCGIIKQPLLLAGAVIVFLGGLNRTSG